MPYNFRLSDFCKYVVIYVIPPDITPMLSKPANADIGGINCTMTPTFGCNWETEEEAPGPLVMTESIPEPINPANIIVSVVAAPPTFIPTRWIHASTDLNLELSLWRISCFENS